MKPFTSGTSVISKSPTKGPLEDALLAVRLDDAEEDEESRKEPPGNSKFLWRSAWVRVPSPG